MVLSHVWLVGTPLLAAGLQASWLPVHARPRPYLDLTGARLLASGRTNRVYEHPSEPGLLVKVRYADPAWRPWNRRFAWQRRLRVWYKSVVALRRELGQYRRAPDLVQRFMGLVDTPFGMGLVVVAEREGDHLAPTLRDLALAGAVDRPVRAALDGFFARLIASRVVIGDVHADNLVYADGPDGKTFVLVDGLGDKTLVPLGRWSAYFRRATKRRVRHYLDVELDRLTEERLGDASD